VSVLLLNLLTSPDRRRTEIGAIMKVSAYHSSNQSDPDVYHDHSDCPTGQQIPSSNKVSGTGGFPRCKQCVDKG
jgi:hypothetical protein